MPAQVNMKPVYVGSFSQSSEHQLYNILRQRTAMNRDKDCVDFWVGWFWPISKQIVLQGSLCIASYWYEAFLLSFTQDLNKALIHVKPTQPYMLRVR